MVLPLSFPQARSSRTSAGLPSSLDLLARNPALVIGLASSRNTSNVGNQSRNTTNCRIPFQLTPGALATDNTNHSLGHNSSADHLGKSIEKISIKISNSEHQRRQWCEEVESLKLQPTKSLEKMTTMGGAKEHKPFSNFRRRRPASRGAENNPKKQEPSPRTTIPDLVRVNHQPVESLSDTLMALDYKSREIVNTTSPLEPIQPSCGQRVRFQLNEDMISGDATIVTMDSTISTVSSIKSKRSTIASKDPPQDISNHRCRRSTSIREKESNQKLYWSPKDLKEAHGRAMRSIRKFQAKHPATVQQVDRIFEEICSSNNTKDEDNFDEEDEEKEEMLRDFLQDWAASGMRGLEEGVTARQMFREDRNMAVESVLTYQERLRAQERSQRMSFSMYLSSTPKEDAATLEHRAELLRARSESTSHRSRMFAMYMALGDALFVANEYQNY